MRAVSALKEENDAIFDACIKRTAQRRYERVLARRDAFTRQATDAATFFDSLERHWPYLANTIESQHIPATNNATEQVIRIFVQDVLWL